jgi:hypothetical protein
MIILYYSYLKMYCILLIFLFIKVTRKNLKQISNLKQFDNIDNIKSQIDQTFQAPVSNKTKSIFSIQVKHNDDFTTSEVKYLNYYYIFTFLM